METAKPKGSNVPTAQAPWSFFDEFNGDVGRMFEQFFYRDPFRKFGLPTRLKGFDFAPTVDVVEKPEAYEITAELPGVEEKDVSVTLDNGIITITGEKRAEKKEDVKGQHISERHFGSFQRSFSLPDDADDKSTSAQFNKGVLKVSIGRAKALKTTAQKIEIKSA
jgi:HSP20 family protein